MHRSGRSAAPRSGAVGGSVEGSAIDHAYGPIRAPLALLIEQDAGRSDLVERAYRAAAGPRAGWARFSSVNEVTAGALARATVALIGDDLLLEDAEAALLSMLERRPDAAAVVLLAAPDPQQARRAITAGAIDAVPFRPETLDEDIAMLLEKVAAHRLKQRQGLRSHAALASAVAHLKRRNHELEKALARFEVLASTDPLTGLANRWRLQEQAAALFAEAVRHDFDLACLMLDLDNFKQVNDGLGHHRGDELLTITGRLINAQIRLSDLAARYGGDEFVLLLPHTSSEEAAILAHRLQRAFRQQTESTLREAGYDCSMSAGVASLRDCDAPTVDALIAAADEALYAAKARAGACVVVAGDQRPPTFHTPHAGL